jgi:peptidyl-prolyl cis-trans isomerase D
MLNQLRNFSKGKLAAVLVAIIIIPFVFWGMGSVFSGGNTNSIGKINNHNISTKDFMDYINKSRINPEILKANIDNNVIEQLLTQLVSSEIINLEISDLSVRLSDKNLADKITNQKTFLDENNNFSRIKYEKFLLENNYSVVEFEQTVKKNELNKKLFTYINGGIKSPYFLANKIYKNQTKKVDLTLLDLNEIYIKTDSLNEQDIKNHIENNKDSFLLKLVDISYAKITPEILTDQNTFNEQFFSIIDEIENQIMNNVSIEDIANDYGFNLKIKKEYNGKDDDKLIKEIYDASNGEETNLLDKDDFFLIYEKRNIQKVLPDINDGEFLESVKNDLVEFKKFEVNKDLLSKIDSKEFDDADFRDLTDQKDLQNLKIESINDNNLLNNDSVKLIYSLSKGSFSLVVDEKNNIYLAKIINIEERNLSKNNETINNFQIESNKNIKNNLYSTYDILLNDKYKIKINQNTLDRVKNYFR